MTKLIMLSLRAGLLTCLLATLVACATSGSPDNCPADQKNLPDCPPSEAIEDPFINKLYEKRTWLSADELEFDPVKLGVNSKIPVQEARTKFLGATSQDAINSIAAKIWMIENAQYTIDATYYIFKRDLIGEALLGALCNAVQRGVDVRLMVDSVGSVSMNHAGLKALSTCADDAGFMRNSSGKITTRKARAQVVIFNAISNVFVRLNRRSHDKLLVIDGHFPRSAMVMTGGRNVSLSYYGINADGSPNPDTYVDAEILLRTGLGVDQDIGDYPVGRLSESYYTILFLFGDNKLLSPGMTSEALGVYETDREQAQAALAKLKALPAVASSLETMPEFFENDWHNSEVLLAHELDNLTNDNIFTDAMEDRSVNENSIGFLLHKARDADYRQRRIVSPYLFAAQYYDDDGNIVYDAARNVRDWLDQNPDSSLEVITNSVLTSDNFPAQAVIDMDMAPRLLLSEEMQKAWLEDLDDSELNPRLVDSEEWRKLVSHPRLQVYETGRIDARELGGTVDYGKLHAKYIVMDDVGFVGTTNFDNRSTLINNEMGFFFSNKEMADELHADFELLKSRSYLWGSPDWLKFRRRVFELDGTKGTAARNQRTVYKTMRAMGVDDHL